MPPKGVNAKKESGRAKKAENENKKKEAAAAAKESLELSKWTAGAAPSNSKLDREEKRKAELARKAENARLLAEEEAGAGAGAGAGGKAKSSNSAAGANGAKGKTSSVKKSGGAKGIGQESTRPAGPGALAAGGGLAAVSLGGPGNGNESKDGGSGPSGDRAGGKNMVEEHKIIEEYSYAATGIDDALDLMELVNARTDKASVGSKAAGLERHPERRFKAAYEAYQERELPRVKEEHPGLRLQQYKDILYKQFQKAPENPFNQTLVAFDASKQERVDALERRNKELEGRLREVKI